MFEPRKNNIPGQRADEPQALRPDDVEIEHLRDCLADALERAANDGTDVSEIQKCLQKLQETAETPIPVDVEDKFRQFQEKHAELLRDDDGGSAAPDDRHRRRRKWTWIGLIAAVVALLSIMFMAGASDNGIQNIFAHWNDDELYFIGDWESSGNSQTNHIREYRTLEEAFDTCEITGNVIPKWIPEQFVLKSISIKDAGERFIKILAEYYDPNTDDKFNIEIKKYTQIADARTYLFEKNLTPIDKYEIEKTVFYVFDNQAGMVTTWISGDLLCSISGNLSAEDFHKMANSIFEGE